MMDVQMQIAKHSEQITLKMQEAKRDISKLLSWQAKLSVNKFESILNDKFVTEKGERVQDLGKKKEMYQMEEQFSRKSIVKLPLHQMTEKMT